MDTNTNPDMDTNTKPVTAPDTEKHWYAFHIYRNSRKMFLRQLSADLQQYYVAEQVTHALKDGYDVEISRKVLFPSIVFVHTERSYVESIRRNPDSQVGTYNRPGTYEPAIISDREMEVFMFVLKNGYEQLDVVEEKLAKGDKVRVIDGVFKGAEGYIVRIKGDRRFVVTIQGIAAVATCYIPQRYLEKLNNSE